MHNIEANYIEIIKQNKIAVKKLKKQILSVSILRTLLFALICIALYNFWHNQRAKTLVIALGSLLFIGLIRLHDFLYIKKSKREKIILINKQEIDALKGNFSNLENGEKFIAPTHYYTSDLDIFGKNSIFQMINRTSTKIGEMKLANWFKSHLLDTKEIKNRQSSIAELAPKIKFRQAFQRIGISNKQQLSEKELLNWIKPNKLKSENILKNIPILIALINSTLLILVILQVVPIAIWMIIFTAFIILNAVLLTQIKTKLEENTQGLITLSTYNSLFQIIEKEKLTSKLSKKIIKECYIGEIPPSLQLKRIISLSDNIQQRNNLFISLLLNGFYLWEFNLSLKIESWKKEHQTFLPKWINTLSQFDALCSLANLSYNYPHYKFPIIESHTFKFNGTNLGHPLMINKRCITNSFSMKKKGAFTIITGANMAGKSTYLRVLGINYLLACMGSVVYADSMKITPSQLITSIKTSDSLSDSESYFFAELKRLKLIIDLLKEGNNLFIILDEILKGTNSVDKLKGSIELIEQLINRNSNGIIATHDLQLTELENKYPENIKNLCFESTIIDNELKFNYKLRKGIVKNMNACFLMKKMGIISK